MAVRHVYPENPILVRLWRGNRVESVHRGAWVVASGSGEVLHGGGSFDEPVYVRSSVKCLQALPLIESGAAERFAMTTQELALALSSHNGEPQHTQTALGLLKRLGLGPEHLLCGASPAGDSKTRFAMRVAGERPCALHHNCSGKHAGFLALATHLGVSPEAYLDPESASQQMVRQAVLDMVGLEPSDLEVAIDGCSAPTFRFPLSGLARAFATFTNPETLAPARAVACRQLLAAAQAHPELIGGSQGRLCTDLLVASEGSLFPKLGAEAVYAVGRVGHNQALAVKIDDGALRGLHAVVAELLDHLGWLPSSGLEALSTYRGRILRNAAGLDVGRMEVVL
ncbi:MAG: asparaginase [Planctomycetes bacterium]|nr:asparaginase [Planctomycetota bacterium]MCB9910854.1 asparaginase [Planctomycetota bacterium]MCB9912214.1 asparaginase [Planctomycetota bacterium]HPF14368.1 asparaginase [Planctomycetota bacterium]